MNLEGMLILRYIEAKLTTRLNTFIYFDGIQISFPRLFVEIPNDLVSGLIKAVELIKMINYDLKKIFFRFLNYDNFFSRRLRYKRCNEKSYKLNTRISHYLLDWLTKK